MKFLAVVGFLVLGAQCLELKNGAYEDFVIRVTESVPAEDCRIVLDNLEATLKSASQYLFSALDSRAFLRSATVLLPPTWPDGCASSPVVSGAGEAPDLTIAPQGPARGRIYTQQSLGCGRPGDQIYLAQETLTKRDGTLARSLVKEFAMYRYGVFEEQGYFNDPIYPMCFYDDQTKHPKITGCSDLPINDNNVCSDLNAEYNITKMVDEKARSSIMFAAESPAVSMFCDEGNHDRFAPTKHNSICQRRSVFQVIMAHEDFAANNAANDLGTNQITDTTPKITYKKQILTRYVFVVESTKDMLQRNSWTYLKTALTYWALNDLPENSEVGIVLAEESSRKVLNIVSLKNQSINRGDNDVRDDIYSSMPWTPSDLTKAGCLHCALKEAVDMLNERTKLRGSANNVIVVIAPGMHSNLQIDKVVQEARKSKIKIASINYPTILREEPLNSLADQTKGVAYTVFEHKLNVESTLLTTYFEFTNILQDIVKRFYSGSQSDLPIEIHRREITDDGRNSITGSFMLDPNMGMPARFSFFTHDSPPLIKSLKLISPSHVVYSNRNDRFSNFKMIRLNSNLSEPGTWTYTVEPYPGNPQPHFIQVMATPLRKTAPIVTAKFWTHQNGPDGPLVLLAEIKRGENPVLGAKVEVTVTKPEINGSVPYKHKFDLLDTGSGDPDITKGDGVYTRYFSAADTGAGLYTFEVSVTDNGNTAYTQSGTPLITDDKPCCGSVISTQGASPISPFQRVLPKITKLITQNQIDSIKETPTGRIGDLKVQIIPEDMKARLSWTSPDMGGATISRYEIKFANTIQDISDGFETAATSWDFGQPLPLAPGSETTFNLDMSQNRDLLDKPLYFAIKGYPQPSAEFSGPISNWVRVLVPSPPPPPTVPPTYSSNEGGYWPNNANSVGIDPVSPSIAKTVSIGLELILPIAIGFLLLVILLVLYCYFCVVKKRDQRFDGHKKSNSSIKNDKLSSTITIVPSSPQHHQSLSNYGADNMPDPHQVGVPIKYDYEEETKKRYSLVNQQEQQLIEELKQQQFVHAQNAQNPNNTYSGLSVISNGSLNRTGHTLSPYNSWSASQLLHEHERRHSPLENMMQVDEHPEYGHQSVDHMSLNGQTLEHLHHIPPPVPPLPAFNSNGYPVNYNIYGVHPGGNGNGQQLQQNPHAIYQSMQRNETMVPFNPSLQGSMSSVNSGDKKRRNVTMV